MAVLLFSVDENGSGYFSNGAEQRKIFHWIFGYATIIHLFEKYEDIQERHVIRYYNQGYFLVGLLDIRVFPYIDI